MTRAFAHAVPSTHAGTDDLEVEALEYLRVRMLVVDPHPLVRWALGQIAAGRPDLIGVGEAASLDEAIALTFAVKPDVIVVALGTNDLGGQGDDPGDKFQTKLIEFLTTIRAAHASSQIVLATSPMLEGQNKTDQEKYYQGAIDARKSADSKITMLKIDTITDAEGFGCDFHPSKATQTRMGTALVAHIKTLTGW